MIKYCKDKWNKNKDILEEALKYDSTLNTCDYDYLLKLVVENILNADSNDHEYTWDSKKITIIDNGDYQGTLLFLIPAETYQPCEYDYLMTYVGYGSCSGCDTLQAIRSSWNYEELPTELQTERQMKDYMTLCKDMVCNMIKPYNTGWRSNTDFEPVEEKGVENDC